MERVYGRLVSFVGLCPDRLSIKFGGIAKRSIFLRGRRDFREKTDGLFSR